MALIIRTVTSDLFVGVCYTIRTVTSDLFVGGCYARWQRFQSAFVCYNKTRPRVSKLK